jgi:UDP-N-acetylglucosamine 4-epimerase
MKTNPKRWLVTGAAGFIGSNLVEALLSLDQEVVGLDSFATGYQTNIDDLKRILPPQQWGRFKFIQGDIRDVGVCQAACKGVDYVLHQAALGSVPRSIECPSLVHDVNVTGTLNMLLSARDAGVSGFVYASSSSVYGDHPSLPKVESLLGEPLSPYAVTKLMDEYYARVFARCYNFQAIGLRYFNVFGPRQDPNGAYAAVIPKWIDSLVRGEEIFINGDGETSRDFCFVANVVQANLLAAITQNAEARNRVYNIALCDRTTLNQLFHILRELVSRHIPSAATNKPVYRDFRSGDVRHSQADISLAVQHLGYSPTHDLQQGLEIAMPWYLEHCQR